MRLLLLQNTKAILYQSLIVFVKCDVYYKCLVKDFWSDISFDSKLSFRKEPIDWSTRPQAHYKSTLMQIWNLRHITLCEDEYIGRSIYSSSHKVICRRFHINTPFTFWHLRTWYMWKVCLQTFRNKRMR